MTSFKTLKTELERTKQFVKNFPKNPPFSFKLDGVSGGWLLDKAGYKVTTAKDGSVERTTVKWVLEDELVICAEIARDLVYPEVEWTVWAEKAGKHPTGQISEFYAIDCFIAPEMKLVHPGINHDVVLTHFKGDYYSPDGFEESNDFLSCGVPKTFCNVGGRSTSTQFPYYTVGSKTNRIIAAVSWQGQWETTFDIDWQKGVYMRSGQQYLDTYLVPGEKLRTPLIAIFMLDDPSRERSVNLWRAWMWDRNIPREEKDKLLRPIVSASSNAYFYEALHATEENQLQFINGYFKAGLPIDFWWIDAMWYDIGKNEKPNWCHVGTWSADAKRFPNGFKPLAKVLEEKNNAGVMAWFEPERVTPGTELFEKHPDWIISIPKAEIEDVMDHSALETDQNVSIDNSYLLDLSRDDVTDWLISKINDTLDTTPIKMYRQDFNTSALRFWREKDGYNRTGITENKYCVNLFRYWDGISAAHPGMLIDTCASGGRRMELETLRRSFPVIHSDYGHGNDLELPAFNQVMYQWIPYFGTHDFYNPAMCTNNTFTMNYGLWKNMGLDMRVEDQDFSACRKYMELWKKLNHCLYGDFYAILPYSRDPREWLLWQFDSPETNDGVIIARANRESVYRSLLAKPRNIDEAASYDVYITDSIELGKPTRMTGAELAAGIELRIDEPYPASKIVYYKKLRGSKKA